MRGRCSGTGADAPPGVPGQMLTMPFWPRSEERRSASGSRQSGGSDVQAEDSGHRRNRSRSPHRRKRAREKEEKEKSHEGRRRKERCGLWGRREGKKLGHPDRLRLLSRSPHTVAVQVGRAHLPISPPPPPPLCLVGLGSGVTASDHTD